MPNAPKVCKPKMDGWYSQSVERCQTAADCCDKTASCGAGFCSLILG